MLLEFPPLISLILLIQSGIVNEPEGTEVWDGSGLILLPFKWLIKSTLKFQLPVNDSGWVGGSQCGPVRDKEILDSGVGNNHAEAASPSQIHVMSAGAVLWGPLSPPLRGRDGRERDQGQSRTRCPPMSQAFLALSPSWANGVPPSCPSANLAYRTWNLLHASWHKTGMNCRIF